MLHESIQVTVHQTTETNNWNLWCKHGPWGLINFFHFFHTSVLFSHVYSWHMQLKFIETLLPAANWFGLSPKHHTNEFVSAVSLCGSRTLIMALLNLLVTTKLQVLPQAFDSHKPNFGFKCPVWRAAVWPCVCACGAHQHAVHTGSTGMWLVCTINPHGVLTN